jgi:hypothetical protein
MNITTLATTLTTSLMNTTAVTTTLAPSGDSVPAYVGYLALSVSILFFGSNYLP